VDPETKNIFHGGHFYGGHICLAMDTLKNIVANLADLLDRQLATIVDIKFNRNLPPNLSGSNGEFSINHGFKAVQIGVSAWTAEALHNTMPMSVFSRSTECHNQDKVSMGTIASRDCIRVIELTEQVAAAVLLAASQALHFRLERGEVDSKRLDGVRKTLDQVFEHFKPLTCDRQLEGDLRKTLELIREKHYAV
jgi:histidine ammonia-lyase